MERKVAVVTGGNKGIGFEICRGLLKKDFEVVLTSRDEARGKAACSALKKEEGREPEYFKLDVTRPADIHSLADYLEKKYGRLDALVNNAGIFVEEQGSILSCPVGKIQESLVTNVFGPILLAQALVPLMKKSGGRIVNLSSGMGQLSEMDGEYPGYRISKTALNAVTRILHSELKGSGILVNSMCPGWVKTDMGGENAPRTPEQGADTAVWLAALPDDGPTGGFFRDRKPIPW